VLDRVKALWEIKYRGDSPSTPNTTILYDKILKLKENIDHFNKIFEDLYLFAQL